MGATHKKALPLLILAMLLPGTAQANAGVPMLFLAMPALAISLAPIIAIESLYLSRSMALSLSLSIKAASVSNLVSTVIGVPLTWLVLVALQVVTGGGSAYGLDSTLGKILAVTWQAPWLIPYEGDLGWMIPVAGLVLLIPFFFVSWWAEYLVSKKVLEDHPPQEIKTRVRNANIITYSLLSLWPVGFGLANHVMG